MEELEKQYSMLIKFEYLILFLKSFMFTFSQFFKGFYFFSNFFQKMKIKWVSICTRTEEIVKGYIFEVLIKFSVFPQHVKSVISQWVRGVKKKKTIVNNYFCQLLYFCSNKLV